MEIQGSLQDLKRRTLDRKETDFCHAKQKKFGLSPDFDKQSASKA
jgi:hypothetical protein